MNSIDRQVNAIVWIAIPRTGTNFLSALLKHHPRITSYYEIFHREKFYAGIHNRPEFIIKSLNQKYHVNFSDVEDLDLINWINQHPQDLLETLIELNPQHLISFKLFPDQLQNDAIERVIIQNDRIAKILVKRNLLDAYISHEIARKVGFWDNYDTSNIFLTLSIEKFIHWAKWAEEWYGLFENNLSSEVIDYSTINYEEIHQHKNNTDKLAYLDNFFNKIGIEFPSQYALPDLITINLQKKQDNRDCLADKITNYDEFIGELKKTAWYDRIIKS